MTLPRLLEMNEYWRVTPPMQESIAAIARFFGLLSPASSDTAVAASDDSAATANLTKDLSISGISIDPRLLQ